MLTEAEYLVPAKAKYKELEVLREKQTFYDHEEAFDQIWRDLGQQVLEKTIRQSGKDRRKKVVITPYGFISIALDHSYSKYPNHFKIILIFMVICYF